MSRIPPEDQRKKPGEYGPEEILEEARRVIRIESEGVIGLLERLDRSFAEAVELLFNCKGRAIVSGVGKSGIVGRKLAATLTSSGTPAVFIHPVDFLHGDMGLLAPEDVFIAVSKSGETVEVERMLHLCKRLGIKVIAITGEKKTSLTRLRNFCASEGEPSASITTMPSGVTTAAAFEMNPWLSVAMPAAPCT